MSMETVVEDIREEAQERAEALRSEAEAEADEIIADAEADAESIREEREREAEREVEQEREQRLSSAKLEAKQERLSARRDVLEDVREQVEAEIAGLEGDTREELTRSLVDAAATEFDADADVDVYGRADDEELIEGVLADYDGFSYAGEYDCLGGVVVESDASRVRVNNTFDSVIESVWEDNLRDVSSRLFEEQ
ncbi:V-type ATP synthase subunit E [Halobacteria archaeon HArc-gm2]|nr:V-type ATP synthase subunit E [Halobacteria archaeon HArc-gm2]